MKKGENAPNYKAVKLKTGSGLARDFIFVSSASRIYELKIFALEFLNLLLKYSDVKKHKHVKFGPCFGTQR